MDPCFEIRSLIDRFLDGDLPETEQAALEEHLSACEACRAGLEGEERIIRQFEMLPELECPEAVLEKIREAVQTTEKKPVMTHRRKKQRVLPFRWGLVPVGLAAAVIILYLIREPSGEHQYPVRVAYSLQEVELARTRAMWVMVLVGEKVRKVEMETVGTAMLDDLPAALRKGVRPFEPSYRGGRK